MKLDKPYIFKHLTMKECPTCKSGVRACSINGQHTSGDQFEKVVFDCGAVLEYSPNFQKIKTVTSCPNDKAVTKLEKIRLQFIEKLEKAIQSLDLKDDCKNQLTEDLIEDVRSRWSYIKAHEDLKQE